jgi:hypothetical protein
LLECPIAEDLQIDQAAADGGAPENKDAGKDVKAEMGSIADCARGCHFRLDK